MFRPRHLADLFRRLLAAGCVGLVLALTAVAASPAAHEWLHQVEQEHTCQHHPAGAKSPAPHTADHDCAIVLFANGVDLCVGPFALTPPVALVASVSPVTAATPDLVAPRYLRQPERGPPVDWVG
jgi:hypothetical protein